MNGTTRTISLHANEVSSGERFEFGMNWTRFLAVLDESRITEAERSLKQILDVEDLNGKSFLDMGSGSGLFSLAARRLGARVCSFDYDPQSVACTVELRRRYFPEDSSWTIAEGSALDRDYLTSLGSFDVVYSWGVLHHTGKMWAAVENATEPVAPGGKLVISIYNDMGRQSERWRWIKRTYNELPRFLRPPFAILAIAPYETKTLLRSLVELHPQRYVRSWTDYKKSRGMSRWHDIVDWVGGYPYEVARPEEIVEFHRARGFSLLRLNSDGVGLGCNEFVFEKDLAT